MAARKKRKGPVLRHAVEISVDVPHGITATASRKRIKAALDLVPTDVLEAGETIVVTANFEGNNKPKED